MQTIEQLHKKFTQTARWLSVIEVNRLIEYYKTFGHKDSQAAIVYLKRMVLEDFCISKDKQS